MLKTYQTKKALEFCCDFFMNFWTGVLGVSSKISKMPFLMCFFRQQCSLCDIYKTYLTCKSILTFPESPLKLQVIEQNYDNLKSLYVQCKLCANGKYHPA